MIGVRVAVGLGIFLFTTASRPALEPTQPPIQWVPGALSLEVKRPGLEADHSPPSSVEVKNASSYTSTPQYAFMAWCSVKSTGTTLPLPLHLPLHYLYIAHSKRLACQLLFLVVFAYVCRISTDTVSPLCSIKVNRMALNGVSKKVKGVHVSLCWSSSLQDKL
jgi:hypothetical protein